MAYRLGKNLRLLPMLRLFRPPVVLLLLLVVALLTACGSTSGSPAQKQLNLYAWSEYIPPKMLDEFTSKTGIKVNYDTFSSNEELLAKLQAGGKGYDLIIVSDYTVDILKKQQQLEALDPARLPNFKNIDSSFKNPPYDPGNRFTVPYQWGTVGLAVNTRKLQRPITRWADLWDPAFKGKVVLLDDEYEVLGMALQSLGYDKNTKDPSQLRAAQAKLLRLRPNIKLFDSDSPKTALLSGEAWLGMVWNGEAALAQREDPAIRYLCPQEGCGIWHDNWAIPKGASHKEAALAFINFSLSPEAGILITQAYPYSNPNRSALELLRRTEPKLYSAYMASPATNPDPAFLKRAQPVEDKGSETPLWDRTWTEVKGEGGS
ncbi:polyamine ABC transporter substrate-binding protein [Gloeobacter kilaueensis]|uniref:Spermidine/putrescine ABC transporter periplasmic substrate-binding protein n=1 Tax=Gloeobacter kilaueensis (strain ATCC BAA-2537 / CCAP 1431/1 / ULC 316 / JS1) TaxID=1183438 RepID=U5QEP1_GLOK1|nr:spermidine/putrescine ABC transporter substrate-binding protein [Gloeobacter kilaueensis]AGY57376.1 spermidine/putrescine ABC transporter periplasmic substrate-binding protein [Gloeobacter kilaueensis JS1]